jgi:hypothetical protein
MFESQGSHRKAHDIRHEVTDSAVIAGQAVYNNALIAIYDFFVLGVSSSYVWKCKTTKPLNLYNRHVSSNHLDVGVGTGFYLDRCTFPTATPKVTLGDLNPNCLAKVGERIKRYNPTAVQMNVFDPSTYPKERFDSIGITYLLHCLPGPFSRKLSILESMSTLLSEGGVLFGSTILGDEAPHNRFGRFLMKAYNRKGIFSNMGDTSAELLSGLMRTFGNAEIEIEGCVALFSARALPVETKRRSPESGSG